jgi:dUTP pyrophosphatase
MKNNIINCAWCSKEFYITPSRLKKNKVHTCSKKCLGKINQEKFSQKITTNCVICEKEIQFKPSRFKGHGEHTCSRSCSAKRNSIIFKGEGNPRALKLNPFEKYFWDKASDIKSKCIRLKWECDIDYKFLIELYNKQNGFCYYSGLPINPIKQEKDYNTLSIDRIDSSRGYTKDNIVLCLLCINYLKSNFDMFKLKKVFDAISLKNKIVVKTKIKLNNPKCLPYKKSEDDAGYDLFANEIIDLGHILQIKTGVAVQPEGNYFFKVFNRSSNYKKGIALANNVAIIDKNYTGEIILNFYKDVTFKPANVVIGDRVAQLIAEQQLYVEFEEVSELSNTERGVGSFGSTGA